MAEPKIDNPWGPAPTESCVPLPCGGQVPAGHRDPGGAEEGARGAVPGGGGVTPDSLTEATPDRIKPPQLRGGFAFLPSPEKTKLQSESNALAR